MGVTDLEQTGAKFQTTRWSLVERLQGSSGDDRAAALAELARIYWPPVYSFLRTSGRNGTDAADATQSFFADVLVERELLFIASGGRLRTLLLTALKRYLIDLGRRTAVRGGKIAHLDIDSDCGEVTTAIRPGDTPEMAFERTWKHAELAEALRRAKAHFSRNPALVRHWEAYEACELRPARSNVDRVPLQHLATTLGYKGAADVAAGVQFVRKRLKLFLDEVRSGGG